MRKITRHDNIKMSFVRTIANRHARMPKSFTDCEACGIAGFCGTLCPVFLAGECAVKDPGAFISEINKLDREERKQYLVESELSDFYPGVKEFKDLK